MTLPKSRQFSKNTQSTVKKFMADEDQLMLYKQGLEKRTNQEVRKIQEERIKISELRQKEKSLLFQIERQAKA